MTDDLQRLNEELRIHQEELEHQNRELREVQQRLEASRDRYADLYDFAPVAYVDFDDRGRIRNINLTGSALLGVDRSRLIDMPFLFHVDPGYRQAFLDHISRCKGSSEKAVVEIRIAPRDRPKADVQMHSVPFRDDERGETFFRTALVVITERKRAERESRAAHEALAESEQRFRSLVENLPVGILIVVDGAVVFRNRQAERLWGAIPEMCEEAELAGVHPEDAPGFRRFCDALARSGESPPDTEVRFLPADAGTGRTDVQWVRFHATRIEYRGKAAHLVILVDITRPKEMEHLLVIRERLASIGQLSAGIAHEIRNPLSGMNIYLSALNQLLLRAEGVEPDLREKVAGIVDQMKSASNRIASVIQRVMEFVKSSPTRMEPVELSPAIEEAVRLSAVTLRKRGIEVSLGLSADLPKCLADPRLIEQVIANLIGNAAQAMEHQHEERRIDVASAVEDRRVVIRVSDSGPGVPPHLRERIFDPFFTTRKEGYGIGLSFSHRVVADHGGSLSVGTSRWGGAEFRVAIPLVRGEAK